MTWKQYCVDFAVLFIRDGGRTWDVASILSSAPELIYALLKSRGFPLKELKKMPPLPQEERSKILQEFCKETSNAESLRSALQSYNISLEDLLAHPLSHYFPPPTPKMRKHRLYVLSERYKEIAELRRQGTTLQVIGQRYGITRERVRQIVLLFNRHSDDPVDIVQARMSCYQPDPAKIERRQKVVELCRKGLTCQQIADTLGIEKQIVFQDIARYNRTAEQPLRTRKPENPKVTEKVKESIIREHKKGATNYALAAKFNVSYGTICRVISEAGLSRPRASHKKKGKTR